MFAPINLPNKISPRFIDSDVQTCTKAEKQRFLPKNQLLELDPINHSRTLRGRLRGLPGESQRSFWNRSNLLVHRIFNLPRDKHVPSRQSNSRTANWYSLRRVDRNWRRGHCIDRDPSVQRTGYILAAVLHYDFDRLNSRTQSGVALIPALPYLP